jgi:uncharacterized membrane protein YphA (DoxX/SURF4 family)
MMLHCAGFVDEAPASGLRKGFLYEYSDFTLLHLRPSFGQDWYAIPLRLIIGYGFMAHGYAKLARGPEHFTNILHVLGMPAPQLLAWATIIVKLLGGFAVLVGAFIPLASIPLAIVLLVATFTVHLPNGFSSIKLQSVTGSWCLFRATGIRDRSTVPRRAYRLGSGRIRTSSARSDLHPAP